MNSFSRASLICYIFTVLCCLLTSAESNTIHHDNRNLVRDPVIPVPQDIEDRVTASPTKSPTALPTASPTAHPSPSPSKSPTSKPTSSTKVDITIPAIVTRTPTASPSQSLSQYPSETTSNSPSKVPEASQIVQTPDRAEGDISATFIATGVCAFLLTGIYATHKYTRSRKKDSDDGEGDVGLSSVGFENSVLDSVEVEDFDKGLA